MDEHDFTLGVDLACSAAHVRDARRRRRPAGVVRTIGSARPLSSCSGLGEGARRGTTAAGDRADPKRLGAVDRLVQSPRRHSDPAAAPVCRRNGTTNDNNNSRLSVLFGRT